MCLIHAYEKLASEVQLYVVVLITTATSPTKSVYAIGTADTLPLTTVLRRPVMSTAALVVVFIVVFLGTCAGEANRLDIQASAGMNLAMVPEIQAVVRKTDMFWRPGPRYLAQVKA